MTTSVAPASRTGTAHDLPVTERPITTAEEAADFPHQCDPSTLAKEPAPLPTRRQSRSRARFVGLDVARGLALVGMVAVHTIEASDEAGAMSPAWVIANGKSSALFAVLGGVGLAFMTGRQQPPRDAAAVRTAAIPLIRGVALVLFGLALGGVVDIADVMVVLPYLGMLFIMAAALVPLSARRLLILGLAWTIVGPVLSQLVRAGTGALEPVNLGLGSLADPAGVFHTLVFTGGFPAITWFAYICIGMAIGRSDLRSRLVIAKLIAGGTLLALMASVLSSVLVDGFGLRERLANGVAGTMTLDVFTEYLVFGGDGTLPADSWWWLGVLAPHTGTPMDLLFTIGTSCAVIGGCLALATVFGHQFTLLALPGSMTLTLYSIHVLALGQLRDLTDGVHFLIQVASLVIFALIWSRFFRRGPLEEVLKRLVDRLAPKKSSHRSASGPQSGTSTPSSGGRAVRALSRR